MNNEYEIGICTGREGIFEGCGEERLIVHKAYQLCDRCNKYRKIEKKGKKPRINQVSDKKKEIIRLKQIVYRKIDKELPHVCTGCGQTKGLDNLDHSHIIPVSEWQEGELLMENITFHGNSLTCGCHRKWESHNPNRTKDMDDFLSNMAYIQRVRPQYYNRLMSKLGDPHYM